MNLIEKIQNLRNRFRDTRADPTDVSTIDGWLEEAKRLFLIKSLKDHDGVKYVLEIFEGEVQKINDALRKSYSKDLPDRERDRLLDRKDLAEKYLSLFKDTDEQLERIEEAVDNEN